VPYTEAFKSQMIRRMVGPPATSATALAKVVGVSQAQLCRWRKKALTLGMPMIPTQMPPSPKSPRAWTTREKLRVVAAAEGLDGEALGALLRREGLHEEQLRAWRDAAAGALESAEAAPGEARTVGERRRMAAMRKRVKSLEKELQRTEKALAKTAALVVLKKKMEAFWEAEGDGTNDETER
jgi:transposase